MHLVAKTLEGDGRNLVHRVQAGQLTHAARFTGLAAGARQQHTVRQGADLADAFGGIRAAQAQFGEEGMAGGKVGRQRGPVLGGKAVFGLRSGQRGGGGIGAHGTPRGVQLPDADGGVLCIHGTILGRRGTRFP
ncbi:hypothetical protein ACHMW6_26520 [Pseudoduganella sp. UC29_106]|uniref:hypothetical protein n=1 Tax=Pseudoduganella sp. UC29_106 TaxID=3374553 RepID=UPI003757379D